MVSVDDDTEVPCGMCRATGIDGAQACPWCEGNRTVLALGRWRWSAEHEAERDHYKAALERIAGLVRASHGGGLARARRIASEALAPSEAEQAAAEAIEDDEPRWLEADPKTWRGGGVMSRRRAAPRR